MSVLICCTVRNCTETLQRSGPRWTCARNHSFDQHRSGYLNLLQPQDSRSREPGDSKEAAQARHRLSVAGHANAVHQAFAHVIRSKEQAGARSLLDVGCGEGGFLRSLRDDAALELHGIDISAPSVEIAAKTLPSGQFIVANADRVLPYGDASFDFVTSIDARINAPEFTRVLKPTGLLLVAVPGPRDLIELRERIQGAEVEKSRVSRIEDELGRNFTLVEHTTVNDTRAFEPALLRDLLTATYRGFRQSERAAVDALTPMTVTLSHEVFAYQRR